MSASQSNNTLSRTMGLLAATSIGVGTMVGAGIFVFPGIAGAQAGPAALLSFVLSGAIALLVAVCTAELATAMPHSGGGYFFISRSFGPFWGTLIGTAQWIGLVFASAFYLVGFGEYSLELLREFNTGLSGQSFAFAVGATVLLLLLNVVGTKNVGRFQNLLVLSLTALLVLVFSYGLIDVLGIKGEREVFTHFFPEGKKAVLTTSALIFTSYLGFVQISTVAGEIKQPSKNLPRALIGSVLIVIILYLLVLFVTTSLLSVSELESMGETATLEVARKLIGRWGAVMVMIAGLLATLSSANASMMSSSRSVFALSKDRLLPKKASKINDRFNTPHISLILVALPIAVMLFRSNLEFFAEVASFLHLVIYAGICLSLVKLNAQQPHWFRPTFNIPAKNILGYLGAACCLGLTAFMETASILAGLAILGVAAVYYLAFQRKTTLPAPSSPSRQPQSLIERILIPVDVSEGEIAQMPKQLIKLFRASHVLVLGYKKIPEQTDPEQSEKEELKNRLEQYLEEQELSAVDLTSEVVRTKNVQESFSQAIEKHDCNAILSAHPIQYLRRILVPLYDSHQLTSRVEQLLKELKASSDVQLQLLLLPHKEEDTPDAEEWKRIIGEKLSGLDFNIDTSYYENGETALESPAGIIEETAKDSDLILLPESDPSDRDSFFNNFHQQIESAVSGPVMVVLKSDKH